jgi:hypothetical protein
VLEWRVVTCCTAINNGAPHGTATLFLVAFDLVFELFDFCCFFVGEFLDFILKGSW